MSNAREPRFPFQISVIEHKSMACWELMLQVGNFATREEAEEFTTGLVTFLEERAAAIYTRRQ